MEKFKSKEAYRSWIQSQDWYQTIELKNGLTTPGKAPTHLRTPIFDTIDFSGRSILDVGCNSGQYSLFAKEHGALRVVGIDIDRKRLKQARTLAVNEGLDIDFREESIFTAGALGSFDIVFCIAVLTEVQDFFGALEQLKKTIGNRAFIELDLAKPLLYVSGSKNWLRGHQNIPRRKAVAEIRQIKGGGTFVMSPSLEVFEAALGDDFVVRRRQGGIRYDLVEVVRKT